MWLLNARTRRLKLFMSDTQVPRYAILSHTWGDDEVSFNDWRTLGPEAVAEKDGFTKIDYCCKQAVDDGLSWAWIDTCCIDKTSSAELSEAINSMFRWYKNASACYAYLSDVGTIASTDRARIERQLAQSRWFTRGWTLQELLAPQNLVLLSKDWIPIGTKAGLRDVLSSITGIEDEFLCGGSLDEASVAKRMSWAATRQTSRVEDMAYCLMGIFDINMPLLYGEGMKAFRRLQEEIMRSNPRDHTLFAW
ncbi:heterokaryon incompatibility protein-domain-containing protein, partial [Lasiosphaeria ovina]